MPALLCQASTGMPMKPPGVRLGTLPGLRHISRSYSTEWLNLQAAGQTQPQSSSQTAGEDSMDSCAGSRRAGQRPLMQMHLYRSRHEWQGMLRGTLKSLQHSLRHSCSSEATTLHAGQQLEGHCSTLAPSRCSGWIGQPVHTLFAVHMFKGHLETGVAHQHARETRSKLQRSFAVSRLPAILCMRSRGRWDHLQPAMRALKLVVHTRETGACSGSQEVLGCLASCTHMQDCNSGCTGRWQDISYGQPTALAPPASLPSAGSS